MKIAILSRRPELYSTRRLVEAAEQRGHAVQVIDVLRCFMNLAADHAAVFHAGEPLGGFDAVIPRIGASVTFYGLAVLRQFEVQKVYAVNGAAAISRARDKLRSLQRLTQAGIDLPVTGFAHAPEDTQALIRLVGGAPLVIKLLEGTQGVGVVLAESQKAASSTIEAFRGLKAYFLVQEYIREAGASDIRCLVVGRRVVAAIRRQGKKGEFRSNLHRGGTAVAVRVTPAERAMAVRAARVIGLNVAGVDLLRSARGPLVMEVNSSPGLKGIESATGEDVAGQIVAYVERHSRRGRPTSVGPLGEIG